MCLCLYDIHRYIEQLYGQAKNINLFTVYCEQGMNLNDFEKIKQKKFSQQVPTKKYNYLHLQNVLQNLLIFLEFFFKWLLIQQFYLLLMLLWVKLSCFYDQRRNILFNVCFSYLSNWSSTLDSNNNNIRKWSSSTTEIIYNKHFKV